MIYAGSVAVIVFQLPGLQDTIDIAVIAQNITHWVIQEQTNEDLSWCCIFGIATEILRALP